MKRPSSRASRPSLPAPETLERLHGRRLLITGGTGFVGRCLLDALVDLWDATGRGPRVWILSRNVSGFFQRYPSYQRHEWLQFVEGDLLAVFDAGVVPGVGLHPARLALQAAGLSDILHAAADTHSQDDGVAWIRQIVDGTRAMLEFATEVGIERFLLTSSGAIYGPQPATMAQLEEHYGGAPDPLRPGSLYGQAKRLAEQYCTVFHHERGLQTVIARCFAFLSKHMPLDGPYAAGNFLRDALFGDEIVVQGDGRAVRSYLHGRDLAHWLLTLLVRGQAGESYNVGSDEAVSLAELAHRIQRLVAPGKPVLVKGLAAAGVARPDVSTPDVSTPDRRSSGAAVSGAERSLYVPDIRRAQALGLSVTLDLDAAILEVAGCLRR